MHRHPLHLLLPLRQPHRHPQVPTPQGLLCVFPQLILLGAGGGGGIGVGVAGGLMAVGWSGGGGGAGFEG